MGLGDRLRAGLSRSREALSEIFYMGGEVDEDSVSYTHLTLPTKLEV